MADPTGRDPDVNRWNHNLHYTPLVLAAVPAGARSALDVGCGEGTLTRALRARVPEVTGLDLDAASIALARAQDDPARHVEYVVGDVRLTDLPPATYDVVTSVAALHHMDARAGLMAMTRLLAPGGVLVIVGLARSTMPRDLGWEAAAVMSSYRQRLLHPYWEHPAPTVWPPPLTFADMRRVARRELPGARFRRHLLWRYSVVWTKPAANAFDRTHGIG